METLTINKENMLTQLAITAFTFLILKNGKTSTLEVKNHLYANGIKDLGIEPTQKQISDILNKVYVNAVTPVIFEVNRTLETFIKNGSPIYFHKYALDVDTLVQEENSPYFYESEDEEDEELYYDDDLDEEDNDDANTVTTKTRPSISGLKFDLGVKKDLIYVLELILNNNGNLQKYWVCRPNNKTYFYDEAMRGNKQVGLLVLDKNLYTKSAAKHFYAKTIKLHKDQVNVMTLQNFAKSKFVNIFLK